MRTLLDINIHGKYFLKIFLEIFSNTKTRGTFFFVVAKLQTFNQFKIMDDIMEENNVHIEANGSNTDDKKEFKTFIRKKCLLF